MDGTQDNPPDPLILDPRGGANQTGMRAHNERLVLSLVRRHGSLSKAEIARRSGLSAQTVSVIMRVLEGDGLLRRGAPVRGKVGQPSIPMSLDPDGVFSIGVKIGRRSADLILVDFVGEVRQQFHFPYPYPLPAVLMDFLASGLKTLFVSLTPNQRKRVAGIGIGAPFELWSWLDAVGAPRDDMDAWRDFDFQTEIAKYSDLPVFIENDATSACSAEHVFGRGREFVDYVYFFVGYFIGGGVVLNHAVYTGRTGNAGALGSMPISDAGQSNHQLIDGASLFLLENMLKEAGLDAARLSTDPDHWEGFAAQLDAWIDRTSRHLAIAAVSACSVIDFEAVLIDGGFPPDVRRRLVEATEAHLVTLDLRGIAPPRIVEATVGRNARGLGAASLPLFSRYLLNQNVMFN